MNTIQSVLLFDLADPISLRCCGTPLSIHCHRDGGHTMNVARAVISPNEIGPNVLLSNE